MCQIDGQGVCLWLKMGEEYPHDHEIVSNNAGWLHFIANWWDGKCKIQKGNIHS